MTIKIERDMRTWGLGFAVQIGEGFTIILGPFFVTGEMTK